MEWRGLVQPRGAILECSPMLAMVVDNLVRQGVLFGNVLVVEEVLPTLDIVKVTNLS